MADRPKTAIVALAPGSKRQPPAEALTDESRSGLTAREKATISSQGEMLAYTDTHILAVFKLDRTNKYSTIAQHRKPYVLLQRFEHHLGLMKSYDELQDAWNAASELGNKVWKTY